MERTGNNAIIVDGLSQSYDGKSYAVKGVSFNVRKGEIYGLLGKNGAGKTTTIRMLTTLLEPTSGRAEILGMELRHHGADIRKKIGVVSQNESFDFTTVENNLKIYGMLWQVPKEVLYRRIDEVLELFDLTKMRKARAFELSGGQKKRLQVAREFLHDMDLLFLDEPTVGMDPIMRRKVLDYIKEKVNNGLTVLFTTQMLDEADYLCDRIGIMDKGKIIVEGTNDELKNIYGRFKTMNLWLSDDDPDSIETRIRSLFSDMDYITDLKVEGPVVNITGKDLDRKISDIILRINQANLEIEKINFHEATLDDVFLAAVS